MGNHNRQFCRNREDVPHAPDLEKVEGDVHMRFQQSLERDDPLFDFLSAVPVLSPRFLQSICAFLRPSGEESFHGIDAVFHRVVRDVDNGVQHEVRRVPKQFGQEHRRGRGNDAHCESIVGIEKRALSHRVTCNGARVASFGT